MKNVFDLTKTQVAAIGRFAGKNPIVGFEKGNLYVINTDRTAIAFLAPITGAMDGGRARVLIPYEADVFKNPWAVDADTLTLETGGETYAGQPGSGADATAYLMPWSKDGREGRTPENSLFSCDTVKRAMGMFDALGITAFSIDYYGTFQQLYGCNKSLNCLVATMIMRRR